MDGRTCLLVAAGLLLAANTTANSQSVTVFEGARLIRGDGGVIENSAFVVEGNRITAVGRRGDVKAPAGATRVDLTGKTVIPALIDAHSHIGYMHNLTSGPQNYTRENILDHMHRFAYFGVAASHGHGLRFRRAAIPDCATKSRPASIPYAARFLTAGRGLAPVDEIQPDNMRHSALPGHDRGGRTRGRSQELAGARREDGQDLGRRPAAEKSASSRHRSIGRSSTRPTSATCTSWSMPPVLKTSRRCCAPASTALRTWSATSTTS